MSFGRPAVTGMAVLSFWRCLAAVGKGFERSTTARVTVVGLGMTWMVLAIIFTRSHDGRWPDPDGFGKTWAFGLIPLTIAAWVAEGHAAVTDARLVRTLGLDIVRGILACAIVAMSIVRLFRGSAALEAVVFSLDISMTVLSFLAPEMSKVPAPAVDSSFLPGAGEERAVLYLFHGLGEHSGRYTHNPSV